MERLVTVEFGPSRSKRFGRAVAEARSGAGECGEPEPGRYRTRFVLGTDSAACTGLARLLERVRHWRATDVYEGDEPVSVFHAKDIKVSGCLKLLARARAVQRCRAWRPISSSGGCPVAPAAGDNSRSFADPSGWAGQKSGQPSGSRAEGVRVDRSTGQPRPRARACVRARIVTSADRLAKSQASLIAGQGGRAGPDIASSAFCDRQTDHRVRLPRRLALALQNVGTTSASTCPRTASQSRKPPDPPRKCIGDVTRAVCRVAGHAPELSIGQERPLTSNLEQLASGILALGLAVATAATPALQLTIDDIYTALSD